MGRKPDSTRSFVRPWDLSDALAEGRTEETRAQDARLLGQLQLAMLLLGFLALSVQLYAEREPLLNPDWEILIGYASLVSVFFCYLLTRIGYFRTSIALSILLPSIYIVQAPMASQGPPDVWWMVYLLVPIIVANTFLRVTYVVGFIALITFTLLAIPVFSDALTLYHMPVIFLLLSSALLIIGRRHLEHQERARRTELAQSRQRYRGLLETVFEGVIIEQGGAIVEANQGAAQMFGYATPDALPREIHRLIPPWDMIAEEAESGLELHGIHADGTSLALEVVARRLPQLSKHARVVALRDVTERRAAERERRALQAQVMRSQKLESLGMLAGGMAHDFNNMLTAILGQAELMRFDSPEGSRAEKSATAIEHAARRAGELTQKLLNFARRAPHKEAPFSLHELVHEVTELLRRTLDRSIVIEEDLRAKSSVIQGDAGQMQQVLMNLTLNSGDAMPKGGVLRMTTRNRQLGARDPLCETGLPPGRYIELTIADTGTGIVPEIIDRIFDPFFTTKEPGKGTGLGLAMAYGIVQSHNGLLTVESEVGVGTTFHLYLPVTTHEAEVPQAQETAPDPGSGHVLLVDDEPEVCEAVAGMLRRLGYDVTTAENGQVAVDIYRDRGGQFRLVILDMVMPVMDGASCFRALKAINPHVCALLSTGYDINDRAREVLDSGMRGYVRKPYRLHELAEAINAALAQAEAARGIAREET